MGLSIEPWKQNELDIDDETFESMDFDSRMKEIVQELYEPNAASPDPRMKKLEV